MLGTSAFFGFGAAPDFKDATQYMLIFAQGGLGLPDRDYYLKDDANVAEASASSTTSSTSRRCSQLAGDTPAKAAAGAKAVMKIETALAKSALDRVRAAQPDQHLPQDVARRGEEAGAELQHGRSILERAEAPPGDGANVTEPEFLKAVDELIASTALDDLKTYMRWHVVHAQRARCCRSAFVDENFEFYGKTLTGAKEQQPRWKRCVSAADSDLGEALGKAYVERTFGAEGQGAHARRWCDAIEAALETDIKEIAWMTDDDQEARREAKLAHGRQQDRLSRTSGATTRRSRSSAATPTATRSARTSSSIAAQLAKIGKPVDKTEWLMTPPTVNAYYNPLRTTSTSRPASCSRRSSTKAATTP